MTLYFRKNALHLSRNLWPTQRWAISHNLGLSKLDRLDRKAIGIAYCDIYAGPLALSFSRLLRESRPMTVGERGVW